MPISINFPIPPEKAPATNTLLSNFGNNNKKETASPPPVKGKSLSLEELLKIAPIISTGLIGLKYLIDRRQAGTHTGNGDNHTGSNTHDLNA